MGVAAVRKNIEDSLKDTPPGHRFGLYFPGWQSGTWQLEKNRKTEALQRVLPLGDQFKKILEELCSRQRSAAIVSGRDRILTVTAMSTSPFLTGIGIEHPLENGFAFMNPYGLAYLPGSSVKGILRKSAEELALGLYGDKKGWSIPDVWWLFGFEAGSAYLVGGKDEKVNFLKEKADFLKKNYEDWIQRCDTAEVCPLVAPFIAQASEAESERERYGSDCRAFLYDLTEKQKLRQRIHQRGSLVFWDVFPKPGGNSLGIDILTPHYTQYYEGGGSPADCGQPVPNPFLVMPPKSAFEFHVQFLPSASMEAQYKNRWKGLLEAAFSHAFEWLGFGAKTSVGYGQLVPVRTAGSISDEADRVMVEGEKPTVAKSDVLERLLQRLATVRQGDAGSTAAYIEKIDSLGSDTEKGKLALAIKEKLGPKIFRKSKKRKYLEEIIEGWKADQNSS